MPVIEFKKKDEIVSIESTITGEAKCLLCNHTWVALSPCGTVWLECPECHSMKGIYIHSCKRENEDHWTCNCGNSLFSIVRDGIYCPNCGVWQYPY